MATNGSFSHQDQYKNSAEQQSAVTNANTNSTENSSGNDLSKDEVGWYFVEQYYTTLSKSPEKLHLFYGKNSQFVSGLEAEVSPVSVGRNAIQERMRELNFQDCKVRVSNVDSQASYDNIVIQVIGETSDKSAELKKFVQTFVLAQQPTGYFVLNDIFRYINEEVEEEAVQGTPEETEIAAPSLENAGIPHEQEPHPEPAVAPSSDTVAVPNKPEEVIEPYPSAQQISAINGTSGTVASEISVASKFVEAPLPEIAEKTEKEEIQEPKKPHSSSPAPNAVNAQPITKSVSPAQPTGPPKHLSWAGRAAAAVGSHPKPAVPAVGIKTAAPAAHHRSAPTASKAVPTSHPPPASTNEKEKENLSSGSGWQTAGENPRKQNRPQSISTPPDKEGTMGYVRNVTEKVEETELRGVLSSFGNLLYFDINRSKNCAFVEFATPEAYQAAAAGSPHQVSGEPIYVEPRRPKASTYGGNGYAGGRGGANQRGRGGFSNRGRGSGASRGRGQANNA